VAANLRIKLKKVPKAMRRRRWNLDKVKDVGVEWNTDVKLTCSLRKGNRSTENWRRDGKYSEIVSKMLLQKH